MARILEIANGGADVMSDAIGLGKTRGQTLAATRTGVNGLKDGGTAVVVGAPHGDPPAINPRDIFGGKIFRGAPRTFPCSCGGSGRAGRRWTGW